MVVGYTRKGWSNDMGSGSDEPHEFVDRRERARGNSGAADSEDDTDSLKPCLKTSAAEALDVKSSLDNLLCIVIA